MANKKLPYATEAEQLEAQRKKMRNYAKYSGMGFQMAGTVLIGALLGRWIDNKMANETPYFTILLVVLFTAAAMYLAIKDFIKPPTK